MAWPTVAVDTTGMDNDTDTLPRSAILDLTTKFNDLIAMRGAASGVCELDGTALVPVARIPAAIARLANPTLTGTPAAPTAALRTNTTQLATTAFVLANGLLNGVLSKAATYAVVAGDYGKLVDATTGTWNLTIDPALGAGPVCAARNSGSGVITLVPATGTIDGEASVALAAGESCLVESDGTNLMTVGRTATPTYKAKVSSNDTTPGYLNGKLVAGTNITLTEGNDGGDETLTVAGSGVGGDLNGQPITAIIASITGPRSVGGPAIWTVGSDYAYTNVPGATAGTWTCLSTRVSGTFVGDVEIEVGTFQRIA